VHGPGTARESGTDPVVQPVPGTAAESAADRGQGIVEYGLILGLIAVVAVIALVFFGGALAAGLSLLGQAIDPNH